MTPDCPPPPPPPIEAPAPDGPTVTIPVPVAEWYQARDAYASRVTACLIDAPPPIEAPLRRTGRAVRGVVGAVAGLTAVAIGGAIHDEHPAYGAALVGLGAGAVMGIGLTL